MSNLLFYNDAKTTLAATLLSTATTAQLASGSGALFTPGPTGSQYFCATLIDAATGLQKEIVHVTNVTGDVVTIVRGQEGTTAQDWVTGDKFENRLTAGTMSTVANEAAPTADKLTTARTFTYTGDATGGPTSFDGSANVSTALTLANTAVTPGTYGNGTTVASVTVDSKGRLTACSAVSITSAPAWTTARTFSYTGDATGGPTSVDGSANVSTALTLATVNASPGTTGDATHVSQITTNGKGLVTSNTAVAIRSATTAQTGLAQLVSSAVDQTLSDATLALTAAAIGALMPQGVGHVQLPGGFILQFGSIVVTTASSAFASGTVTFPVSFSTTPVAALATTTINVGGNPASSGNNYVAICYGFSATQMSIRIDNNGSVSESRSVTVSWFAIGK